MTLSETFIVADDHPMFREAICQAIQGRCPNAELFQAGTMQEAVEMATVVGHPDMFVLDLLFPGMEPQKSIGELRQQFPQTSIVVISMMDDQNTARNIIEAGADGFIGKSLPSDEIVEALLAVRNGEFVIRVPNEGAQPPATPFENATIRLSPRQSEVLDFICEGRSNKEIGRLMALSHFTVRAHLSSLFRILGVSSRKAAISRATSLGLHKPVPDSQCGKS